MTIDSVPPDDRGGPAVRPGRLRHQGGHGGDAVGLRPAGPRAARGLGVGRAGLHGGRGVHAHGVVDWLAETGRGRPGDRGRADAAGPGHTPQGGRALEDPHPGRGLPQLDPGARARTRSTAWRGSSRALDDHAGELGRGHADPMLGPPSLSVGRIEGGRASTSCPTACEIEIDRRMIPGETASGLPSSRSAEFLDRAAGEPRRRGVPSALGEHAGARHRDRTDWVEPLLKEAVTRRRGRAPDVIGVPLRHRRRAAGRGGPAVRRLRPRRHRPGPHPGRVDRTRPGPDRRPRPITRSPGARLRDRPTGNESLLISNRKTGPGPRKRLVARVDRF